MCRRELCQFFLLLFLQTPLHAIEHISYSDTSFAINYDLVETKSAVATIHGLISQKESVRLIINDKFIQIEKYFDRARNPSLYIETDIYSDVLDQILDLLDRSIDVSFTFMPRQNLLVEDGWLKKIFAQNWYNVVIKGSFDFLENIFENCLPINDRIGVIVIQNLDNQTIRITKNDISYFFYHKSDAKLLFRTNLLMAALNIPYLETIILRGRINLPENVLQKLSKITSKIKLPMSQLREMKENLSHFRVIHVIDDEKIEFVCDYPSLTKHGIIFRINNLALLNDEDWKIMASLPLISFECIETLSANHAEHLNQCKTLRAVKAKGLLKPAILFVEAVELESFNDDTVNVLGNLPNLSQIIISCQNDDVDERGNHDDAFITMARSKKLSQASKTTIFGIDKMLVETISFGNINAALIKAANDGDIYGENCLHFLSCIDSDITDETLQLLGNFIGLYSLNLSGSRNFTIKGLELVMNNYNLQSIILPLHMVEDLGYLSNHYPHIEIFLGDA